MVHSWKIFIIVFLFFLCFCDGECSEKNLIQPIEEGFLLDWKLDKDIINKLTFSLTKEKYSLVGETQKYILVDNNGPKQLWLFKTGEPLAFIIEEAASKWGKLCGVNLPYVHRISLPINNVIVWGTIQKMLCNSETVDNIKNLNSFQIDELQKHFIFDYFIENNDSSKNHFLIIKDEGKLYGIDKDDGFLQDLNSTTKDELNEFFFEDVESFACDVYADFWNLYINKEINIDFTKGLALASFMKNIDDHMVYKIFNPMFEIEGAPPLDFIDKLICKKSILYEKITNFYKLLSKKREEHFSGAPSKEEISDYEIELLEKIEQGINEKIVLLEKLKEKSNFKQKNIDVIASREAWMFIVDKIFIPILDENVSLQHIDLESICRYLKTLRNNSKNIMEKLAISIYILRINELSSGRIDCSNEEDLYRQIPVVINPELLNVNSLKEEYLSIIEGGTPLIDINEEYIYAMNLAFAIKEERRLSDK
ncbi:MAG: hypothetical protein ISS47_06880 [Candidatus Omnitrophica bacterium]|nr:hypothetical protein [Candidatus Omnitrophota bacterium]